MNALIVLTHPDPSSFNHALANVARDTLAGLGFETAFHDLCAENFPPVLPAAEIRRGAVPDPIVESHVRELERADLIVVVHPNWWGKPPAVMAGWIDRVFRPERAYRFLEGDGGEGVPEGLLKAKAAVVFNTADTAPERERRVFGDPLERIWKDCVFGLCGVTDVRRHVFGVVCTSTPAMRREWLNDAARIVRETAAAIAG